MWGGRFRERPDDLFARFNSSFRFDVRLLDAELEASRAYADALVRAGLLSPEEGAQIAAALQEIGRRAAEPDYLEAEVEDVHSFVELRLRELVGDLALKLHTGRSRNEQVAVDLRLYLKREIEEVKKRIYAALKELVALAGRASGLIMPGYTHLQPAQPLLFAHYLLAYYEMLRRDLARLEDCCRRLDESPLGSGAIAGTAYRIDRELLARALGFARASANSVDAVSDRDFIAEFIFCAALAMVHLSRLAEDFIVFASAEFGFIALGDAVTTGSSLMPQKRNPDALELIRGKAARVIGDLNATLALLKGLPLSYNKDLQEDKGPLFDAVDTLKGSLEVIALVLKSAEPRGERMARALAQGYLLATELADYLVARGLEFRKAHEAVGRLVLYAEEKGARLEELSLEEMKRVSPLFEEDVRGWLDIERALVRRCEPGGTAPERVAEALARAQRELEEAGF